GLLDGEEMTDAGRDARERVEAVTDAQMEPAMTALGDNADRLFAHLEPWARAVVDACGYLRGPTDLARPRA
ncbi:MAG: hypothetical protein WD826_01140, partial [Actinomycetota bacterium]